jgi:HD-like signal output (HDOD) protein
MVAAGILIASMVGLGAWMLYRRPLAFADAAVNAHLPPVEAVFSAEPIEQLSQIETHSLAAAARLWRLAFNASAENQPLGLAHVRVRQLVCAKLEVDFLDPRYFPRRPTLMPQLLQALDDPRAESEKLSRMIAHDPVLAADVLRLANSSLYRASSAPVETIQRAIVVCGVDALRGIIAAAMLRPVFRANRINFPRFPRMLWERTERAARAAELYAAKLSPQDRFEAQLTVLLNALGPLVVYGTTLDAYASVPTMTPDAGLCVELIGTLGRELSRRIARDWQTSPRLVAALENSPEEPLSEILHVGELLGTLSFLQSQTVMSAEQTLQSRESAGLHGELSNNIWSLLAATR